MNSININLVIVYPDDAIQKVQAEGHFYEEEDLKAISAYFKPGQVFVDIGSNTGQHSIYFLKVLGASEAIFFEPIEQMCSIIRENVRLNHLESVSDLSHLGFGISEDAGNASFYLNHDNLGGSALSDNSDGSIPLISADAALEGKPVHFIKIDTEGFEIKVLKGLVATIRACRPVIFIEVDDENANQFAQFVRDEKYEIAWQLRRYEANENFLLIPIAN